MRIASADDSRNTQESRPIPGSAEQPRFNPVDGFTYMTIPSVGVLVFDPNAGSTGAGALAATFTLSNCSGNGNWIDPVTDTMLVGCNNVAGQALVTVDGFTYMTIPSVGVLVFDPNAGSTGSACRGGGQAFAL